LGSLESSKLPLHAANHSCPGAPDSPGRGNGVVREDIRVDDVPEPVPGPGEVKLRNAADLDHPDYARMADLLSNMPTLARYDGRSRHRYRERLDTPK
jgi:hypothetical protein